jgi:putative transposase
MRMTRSQEHWQTIIDNQKTSGLTIIDYCQQQQLSTSNFYAVKKKLALTSGNFVRAKITQQVKILEAQGSITLTMGQANVYLPSTTSATYLSQLLRALVL